MNSTPIKRQHSGFPFHHADKDGAMTPHDGQPYSPASSTSSMMSPRSMSLTQEPEKVLLTSVYTASPEEEAALFAGKREILVSAIQASSGLVTSLEDFNAKHWAIRYPHQLGVSLPSTSSPSTPHQHRAALKRSQTIQPSAISEDGHYDPSTSSPLSLKQQRPDLASRSYSTTDTNLSTISSHSRETSATSVSEGPVHPLSILSLDLKLGTHSTGPSSLPALLPSLSQATLAQLLGRRFASALKHLDALRVRVQDTSSRILVTGDLNAGKSTFVNALLRRDLLPVDQQPCTTVFCEVLDAKARNNGVEEVHAIKEVDVATYDPTNESSFTRFGMDQLDTACTDAENEFVIVKVYVNDSRANEEAVAAGQSSPSFVRNGLVSISLIDAPGLNRDTLSTTALFARQSEIDVIVFVVSAENHFALSAKEFLLNASSEKAYVFVVVNKFQGIRDKARCQRLVGKQINQLSPRTWESRSELVHFVEAEKVIPAEGEDGKEGDDAAFANLEHSLRSFVLLKRAKSKLAPAKHYLVNLLSDLGLLAEANVVAAEKELEVALAQLDVVKPIHERLTRERDEVNDGISKVEESRVDVVRDAAWTRMDRALQFIAKGEIVPACDKPIPQFPNVQSFEAPTGLPAYPGFLGIWSWANEVKATLMKSLEAEVRAAEEDARQVTVEGVREVTGTLANRFLPDEEKSAKEERVFKPEVMFAKRRRALGSSGKANKRLSLGSAGLGLAAGYAGLGSDAVEVSVLDLFDLERLLPFGNFDKKVIDEAEDNAGALSVVSLGVGAMTMFGSRAVGVKGLVDTIARTCEVLGSAQARKWAGPVIGVLTIGLAVFIVVDLPRAVPRNIGRKLQLTLDASPEFVAGGQPQTFAASHADRISRETRKVLRLAGWDLRERFRAALERSEQERKEVEGVRDKSSHALKWLASFVDQLDTESVRLETVNLEDKMEA